MTLRNCGAWPSSPAFTAVARAACFRPQDLDRIAHWQARTSPEWAQRYVKKETWEGVLAFIEASRAAVQREAQQRTRQRLQKRVLLMTLSIVLVAATLVLAVFSYRAETAKAAAQQALTNSYVRTIGVSDGDSISPDELAALWELAELDRANAKVRELVIDHWFENEVSVQRALNRDASGLRAAIGTNPELQAYTVRRAEELAGRLVTVLEDPKETDADRLSTLGRALAELAAKMEPKEAAAVAGRGAQRLAGLLDDPKETDADRLFTLGEALAELAAKMEPKEAAAVAGVARGAWSVCWRTRRKSMLTACLRSGRCWPGWRPRWSPRRQRVSPAAWSRCSRTRRKPMLTGCQLGEALAGWRPRWSPRRQRLGRPPGTVLEDPKETDTYRLSASGRRWPSWRPRWSPRRQRLWRAVARGAWPDCWRTRRKPMLTAWLRSRGRWPSWRPRWSPRRQRLWRGVARSAWPAAGGPEGNRC